MNSIVGIAVKDIKSFFRERGTVFWTIAFPIVILLLFSAIFGREIPFNANIGIVDAGDAPATASITQGLGSLGIFTVRNYTDKPEALKDLEASTIRAVITVPQGFSQALLTRNASVLLKVDETSPDVARLIRDAVKTYFSEYYKSFYSQRYQANYTDPIVINEEPSVSGQILGYKENIVPGMLTYPLLFSSMVVSTGAIVFEREKGTLKKIRASPIRPINVLFGKTLAALFQTAISIMLLSVLAAVVLRPNLAWNLPLLIPVLFLGSMNGIALGLIISCIGRAPQEASNAATTMGIMLQFFTGLHIPILQVRACRQQIGRFIPMTYAAQALRDIMIRHATPYQILLPLATLAISAIGLYAIGVLLYKRWVEK